MPTRGLAAGKHQLISILSAFSCSRAFREKCPGKQSESSPGKAAAVMKAQIEPLRSRGTDIEGAPKNALAGFLRAHSLRDARWPI
jgi:hypothetical protein